MQHFSACPERNRDGRRMSLIWFLLFSPLPRRLVSTLTLLSKKLNCYKTTLECSDKNVAFYQKFDYNPSNETYMQCRFFDWGRRRPLTSSSPKGRWWTTHTFTTTTCLKTGGKRPRSLLGVSWIAPIEEMFELSAQPSAKQRPPCFKIEQHLKGQKFGFQTLLAAVIGAKHWAEPTWNWKYFCEFE